MNEGWQLVPSVLSTYTPARIHDNYDYRENGYWHLLRTQVMSRNESADDRRYEASNAGIYHDDRAVMRGALLEGTFEPMWVEYTRWAPQRGVVRPREEDGARPQREQQQQRRRVMQEERGEALVGGGGGLHASAAPEPDSSLSVTFAPVAAAAAPGEGTLLTAQPAAAGEAATLVFVPPKKPRRQLGMAQNQAGAPVIVETVKPAV